MSDVPGHAAPGARMTRRGCAIACIMLLAACSAEKRETRPAQPLTPPNGPSDPRIALVENNRYQVSQGGRYFTWYGCGACHGDDARGVLDLGDGVWHRGGGFDRVYDSIAHAHRAPYGVRIPTEQLWQITAYVRELTALDRAQRRRQDLDQTGEPQAETWPGPVR